MKVFNKNYSLLRDKQIEGYSAASLKDEVVELNQPQKKFDYENGEVLLDVRHLKQFFRFGKGEFITDGSISLKITSSQQTTDLQNEKKKLCLESTYKWVLEV